MTTITSLILFLFPRDVGVTLDGMIMHKGERPSIYLELRRAQSGLVTMTLDRDQAILSHSIRDDEVLDPFDA